MKFVKLLTAAHVAGVLRHPHEGVLHVDDAEAERLVESKVGEDVTADFTAKQNRDAPVEAGTEPSGSQAETPANPHQAEVETDAPAEAKPARRKAAADKE
ncbi:hypothetical protein [Sphingomonas sp. 3-13AW]|uniref:hypothetical protein n=1 Tax=Sphingomonas sp. 3-13AW TaxID=3050450 RepID=UPI003BB805F6